MNSKKYPLPSFLQGTCTIETYEKWLDKRANEVYKRDLNRRKPFALTGSVSFYKESIHAAVVKGGVIDPYTGETLRWDLIGTWYTLTDNDPATAFNKDFFLLPTVDHKDADAETLDLEICSWLVNTCKNLLNPADFVAFCKKVAAYRNGDKDLIKRQDGRVFSLKLSNRKRSPLDIKGISTKITTDEIVDIVRESRSSK